MPRTALSATLAADHDAGHHQAGWMQRAACAGADPAVFFEGLPHGATLGFCARCPVLDACASHALSLDEDTCRATGVLAAMTSRQRRAARRLQATPAGAARRAIAVRRAELQRRARAGQRARDEARRTEQQARRTEQQITQTLQLAATTAGVPVEELRSTSRAVELVVARQWAWRRLRGLGLSLPDIGRLFDRDHTTVLSGLRAAESHRAEQVQQFAERVEDAQAL